MIRHIHSSSRYDRTAISLYRAMLKYAETANLVTFTEIHKEVRADALRLPGWDIVWFPGAGASDPAIAYNVADFEVLDSWSTQTTGMEQRRGPGGPRPPHATTALMRDISTNKKFLVSVIHLPSNVQGAWADNSWRVIVWTAAHRGWHKSLLPLRRKHTNNIMMVADWNLDFKKLWVRALVKSLHPKLTLTWRKPWPQDGTHGRRVIDGTLTNLLIAKDAHLVKDDSSSDHRPYGETLR